MEVGVEYKIVAEGLDAGDGGEFAIAGGGEIELDVYEYFHVPLLLIPVALSSQRVDRKPYSAN